jgi:hypothetical protein
VLPGEGVLYSARVRVRPEASAAPADPKPGQEPGQPPRDRKHYVLSWRWEEQHQTLSVVIARVRRAGGFVERGLTWDRSDVLAMSLRDRRDMARLLAKAAEEALWRGTMTDAEPFVAALRAVGFAA